MNYSPWGLKESYMTEQLRHKTVLVGLNLSPTQLTPGLWKTTQATSYCFQLHDAWNTSKAFVARRQA